MFPFYKTRFKAEKNERAEAHTPYPSHSKQQEEGATADNKHVLIFGWYQPVTATAKKRGSGGFGRAAVTGVIMGNLVSFFFSSFHAFFLFADTSHGCACEGIQ